MAKSPKPFLQVALDFVDLARALQVAEEAAAGGADGLEVGTPLIKSEGLDAVRAMKQRFPDRVIIADMKTIDAGRAEVEIAAKAGAGVVVVLAGASDATIRECLEAGRNYGVTIQLDLLGVASPAARAQELEALGVGQMGVHTPIDQQMQGANPFDLLRDVRAVFSGRLAVAGGINSETAAEAVRVGAQIVIVGGAITKAKDARAATAAIRKALDTGEAVATDLYKRVTAETVREALTRVSCANISDAMHRSGDLPGIRPVVDGVKMVGPVVTVRTAPGDWGKPVQAIDHAQPGEIVAIDAGGVLPAVWGELATRSAQNRGLAGVVIDGGIRDVADIRALRFPAFSRLISPTAGEPKGYGEIGASIRIAGVRVNPGDWLVGDDDGVVCVPREQVAEIANRAMSVLEAENRLRGEIERGRTLSEVAELLRWEKK
jgi:3-hexulose-6-phosphate synthase/6-phospho-3-hexuloisomerase